MEKIKDFVKVLKALSDENRLRIVMMLLNRNLCVCEINETLNIAFSTISAHLKTLKYAGIIEDTKNGRWVEYKLTENKEILSTIHQMVDKVRDDSTILRDKNFIFNITKEQCSKLY